MTRPWFGKVVGAFGRLIGILFVEYILAHQSFNQSLVLVHHWGLVYLLTLYEHGLLELGLVGRLNLAGGAI